MEINITAQPQATIVAVTGRLDALTSEEFERQCTEALGSAPAMVIDLKELQYISSAGLRAILKLVKLSQAQKRELLLCSLQPAVLEVFKLSGFAGFLRLVDDQAAALTLL